jgi:hypothetical protein
MKKIQKSTLALAGLLMAFSFILFSFKTPFGGDSFTIHLNNKLVLQEYLHDFKGAKSLTLDAATRR